jgi:hypothetical protein
MGVIFGLGTIIIIPIFAIIGSFIGAAIVFVIWYFMGSSEDYQTAFRCNAYLSAIFPLTTLLELIPYLGIIVSSAWSMYLVAIASIEVHQLSPKRSYMVFGILTIVIIVFSIDDEIANRNMMADAEILQKQYASPN